MDPATIATIGSLLVGFFGNKKKNKVAQQTQQTNTNIAKQNADNDLLFRQQEAARQDVINRGATSVANQSSAADERNRLVRNQMAQALLATLQPDTVDKGIVGSALESNSKFDPIVHTAAPATPVKASTVPNVQAPQGTGMVYDAISRVLGAVATAEIEKKKEQEYMKGKSGSNLTWSPEDVDEVYGGID